MRIRRVHSGDGGELCHVFVRAAHGLGADAYAPDQLAAWTSRITPTRLEDRLLSTVSFAAEEDGRLVGFSSFDPDAGELDFLYVHPAYVGRGIGRELSVAVEREAAKANFESVELTASLNAVPIYERLGYRRESAFSKVIDGVEIPCFRMRKPLARERLVHGVRVRGLAVGPRTECAHYFSSLDVVAIRFPCCGDYFPCYECHLAVANHAPKRWRAGDQNERAILCGACGSQLTVRAYLGSHARCPACGAGFNPGCRRHHHLYFDL